MAIDHCKSKVTYFFGRLRWFHKEDDETASVAEVPHRQEDRS